MQEKNVPINIKITDKNIKHEQKSIRWFLGSEMSKPIIEKFENNEIKERRTVIPKAIGNNHFFNGYSFWEVNKSKSTRIGVIIGIRYIIKEFSVYLKF